MCADLNVHVTPESASVPQCACNARVCADLNVHNTRVYSYPNVHKHQRVCLLQCSQTLECMSTSMFTNTRVYVCINAHLDVRKHWRCMPTSVSQTAESMPTSTFTNTRECVATSACRKCQHMPLPRCLFDVKVCVHLPRYPFDVKECVCLPHTLVMSKSVCAYLIPL